MTAPVPSFPFDQLFSGPLSDVLTERSRAIAQFGHDADADDALPLPQLGEKAREYLQIAIDRATGTEQRRALPQAYRKAIQSAALTLAFAAAIQRQITRENEGKEG